MNVQPEHIAGKPKKIGLLKGLPVMEVTTKGGLHMIVMARNGGIETLGTGPHRAVARHIAMEKEPDLELTELSKSDWIDPSDYEFCLPKYRELTAQFRTHQGLDE